MAFFRAALEQLVGSVVGAAGLTLSGPLGSFDDVTGLNPNIVVEVLSDSTERAPAIELRR